MKALLQAAVAVSAVSYTALAETPPSVVDLENKLQWTLSGSDDEHKIGLEEVGERVSNTYVGFFMRCRRGGLNTISTDLIDTKVIGSLIQRNEPISVSLVFDGQEKPIPEVLLAYNLHDSTWEIEFSWSERDDALLKQFTAATQVEITGDGINVLLPRSGITQAFTQFQQRCTEIGSK
jgi:hypothetical protein